METLRALFVSMRLASVETFIASGNVIFETNTKDIAGLHEKIARSLHKSLGYEVSTFLRTDAEVSAIARYKPFPDEAMASAVTFCVGFLGAPPSAEAERKALGLKTAMDDFHLHGSELYWLSRQRQSESSFSNAVFEKAVGVRATFRGMNTIQRLTTKYPAPEL
jgi:uncharacterized protein (DUF1697 family)